MPASGARLFPPPTTARERALVARFHQALLMQATRGRVQLSVADDVAPTTVPLSPAVTDLLLTILAALGSGEAVRLTRLGRMFTAHQTASLLGLTPAALDALVRDGTLASYVQGNGRRFVADDVITLRRRRLDARQRARDAVFAEYADLYPPDL
ncbi:hypothetical protein [Sandaracinobacteroides saxicola]|uniref:Helix-turn-helix domain-containing protein n=1 Tax=Sandaracinobacteroides saxicola TaxID=2759707 RepID=A0A7G5IFL4_9SPHN|nr:hypothetical protein [Sandaracinobacteroides saxicola]QMW22156.1 hypothetical protein H3309_12375 [Sandaracinobacteroides saxicola]